MKFLVDVCAGGRLAEWLKGLGHDVKEVREKTPTMTDKEVLAWAVAENRVILTVDKDFGEMAIVHGERHCGIIRLPDVPFNMRKHLVEEVLTRHSEKLIAGGIITATANRIRVRYQQ